MKRLSLWGRELRDPRTVSFEWPTQSMVDMMEPNVRISSITFGSNSCNLASVQISLTNGMQSPVFDKPCGGLTTQACPKIINFDPRRPVREISAAKKAQKTFGRIR